MFKVAYETSFPLYFNLTCEQWALVLGNLLVLSGESI